MPSELHSPVQEILEAFTFAARMHRDQTRGDGVTPYYAHVVRVTWILRVLFEMDDQAVIIAAICHDLIEDTAVTRAQIADRFGETVATYVAALSKDMGLPEDERDQEYHRRLAAAPEIVQIAKLADIYDNLSARAGTPKQQRTAENARKLIELFRQSIQSERGRQALARTELLLGEIDREADRRSRRQGP
jgi:(p)ppGpp synthase/HD superfamily hydrolase